MSLYAFNMTASPVILAAGNPAPTLPASSAPPARSRAFDVTSELRPNLTVDPAQGKTGGLTGANYISLQAQVTAGTIEFEWTSDPEYLTTGLTINGPTPGLHALVGADHTATGLVAGQVVKATSATEFVWGTLAELPSTGEKAALVGSSGTPGASNLYLTQSDTSRVTRTTASMQVYVNGTLGSDSNDGLTALTPKLTLQAAYDLIPYYVGHSCTINLSGIFTDAGGTCAKYIAPSRFLVIDGSSSMTVVADNGGANFTPDIFSVSTLGLTTAGWVADAYKGYLLEIVSGTCAGQTRMIQGNTTTTLTPVRNFSVTPDATSVFRIVRPTTTFSTDVYPTFKNDGPGTMIVQRLYQNAGTISCARGIGTHVLTHIVSMSPADEIYSFAFVECGNVQLTASIRHPTTYALQSAMTASQAGVSQIAYAFTTSGDGAFGVYTVSNLTLRIQASVLNGMIVFRNTNTSISQGSRIQVFVNNGVQMNSGTALPGITTSSGYATTKFGGNASYPGIQVINGSVGIGDKVEFVVGGAHHVELYHAQAHLEGCYSSGDALGFGLHAKGGSHISIRPAIGTGTNTTFAIAGSTVTLTGSGTFTSTDVGRTIMIDGATTPGNDGTFIILTAVGSVVTYTNAAGATEAGAGNYYIGYPAITGATGDLTVDGTTEETDWATVCAGTGTPLVDATKQLVTVQKFQLTGFPA